MSTKAIVIDHECQVFVAILLQHTSALSASVDRSSAHPNGICPAYVSRAFPPHETYQWFCPVFLASTQHNNHCLCYRT